MKFALAVNAEYVLARHRAGYEINANVDFLLRLTAWALNHHHELSSFRHAFLRLSRSVEF
jgi:hypothetical protein